MNGNIDTERIQVCGIGSHSVPAYALIGYFKVESLEQDIAFFM